MHSSTGTSPTHIPGITGLRGVAVSAVVAYHLGLLPGGFVGVDVFFVLSGFLITSLLLSRRPTGVRGLARWWGGRFRRLTPAVAVVVLAVLVVFATMSGIALDALATLTWWQNWHLVAEGTPYWATAPSPLRHAWSLSIEEQFYLVWPAVLLGLLAASRRRGLRRPELLVAAVAGVGAVASFAWAAHLAVGTDASLSRIYFGTDTRAGALLAGCTMAALGHGRRRGAAFAPTNIAAAVAGATLILLCLTISPEDRFTYTGGLLLAAGASLVLVHAASRSGPLSSALDIAPLQWLGVRSYGIYLWSWPVQVALEERGPDLPRWSVVAITVLASLTLAAVSLRLVEDPLRRTSSWARRLRPRQAAWSGGAAVLIVAMLVASGSTRATAIEQVAADFERVPDPTTSSAAPAGASNSSTTTTTCPPAPPTSVPEFGGELDTFDDSTVTDIFDPQAPACGSAPVRVLVVGDSTGRGAANALLRQRSDRIAIWDRTELGCGLVSPSTPDCSDWRALWTGAVATIDPEVVVVVLRASEDLIDGPDPDYTSDEAGELRRSEMAAATEILASSGAEVVWVLPAAPLPRGAFYCKGRSRNSPCDPDWVERWRADLAQVAAASGAVTLDLQPWVDGRVATREADRPDGLHFSGPALDANGEWILSNLFALGT